MNGLRLLLIMSLAVLAGSLSVLFSQTSASGAGTLPAGFAQSRVAGGLTAPTTMAFAPDGRLFVAEQAGRLRIIQDGRLLETPFLDIAGRVNSNGERGLLGVAFDPNFSANRYVYVYYTQKAVGTNPAHNRIVRFTASGNRALLSSERLILRLNDLSSATNHNGGAIHFRPDGKLYVAVGDNANGANAQSLQTLKGKMLRINKNGSIPEGNPFYGRTTGKNRAIWALGLRNPYSFAVQRGTGKIYINDVGEQIWEDINCGLVGANYGWILHEGPESALRYSPLIFAYRHGNIDST